MGIILTILAVVIVINIFSQLAFKLLSILFGGLFKLIRIAFETIFRIISWPFTKMLDLLCC